MGKEIPRDSHYCSSNGRQQTDWLKKRIKTLWPHDNTQLACILPKNSIHLACLETVVLEGVYVDHQSPQTYKRSLLKFHYLIETSWIPSRSNGWSDQKGIKQFKVPCVGITSSHLDTNTKVHCSPAGFYSRALPRRLFIVSYDTWLSVYLLIIYYLNPTENYINRPSISINSLYLHLHSRISIGSWWAIKHKLTSINLILNVHRSNYTHLQFKYIRRTTHML